MILKTEVISTDQFEEIEEFEMPLEKNSFFKLNIDRELALLGLDPETKGESYYVQQSNENLG